MTFAFSNLSDQRAFGGKLIVVLTWLMAAIVAVTRVVIDGPFGGVAIACVAIALEHDAL